MKYLVSYENDWKSLIIIVRMIGLLMPIKRQNFNPDSLVTRQFTKKFLSQLRGNLNNKIKLKEKSDWNLFKNGLIVLFTLQFLYGDDNDENLVYLIIDEQIRREIADGRIEQLLEIDKPMLINSNWIDLLTIIDPQKIQIKYLNLASSFEIFINCLIKINESLLTRDFYLSADDLRTYFEERLQGNHLTSKFLFFFLLKISLRINVF